MIQPKISVITINYNNRQGLEKTLKSVVSQSFKNFEYIVIDGDSTDGSKDSIENYASEIEYWVSEPDSGIYNAMNKGIEAAKGEYLLFLNSGDEFYETSSLEKAIPYLNGEDIIYGNLEIVDDEKNFIKNYSSQLSLHYFYIDALPHPGSFIKKTAFDNVGMYDENLKIVSDWKWFFEAFAKHSLQWKYIPVVVSRFYMDGVSSNMDKVNIERQEVFNSFPTSLTADAEIIENLKREIKSLQEYKHRYNHLKKYRLVKLLAQLNLIKIP